MFTMLKNNMFLLMAAIFACLPVMRAVKTNCEKFAYSHGKVKYIWNFFVYSLLPVVLLLLSTAALVGDSYNPFIYFQF